MNDKILQDFLIAQQKTDQTFIDEIDELKKEINRLKKTGIITIRCLKKRLGDISIYDGNGNVIYTSNRIVNLEENHITYEDLIIDINKNFANYD